MNIKIIAIGKLKEDYLKSAMDEYTKRLGRFAKLTIVELPEARLPDKPSEKDEAKVKEAEAAAILAKIERNEFVICLSPSGKQMDSSSFAGLLPPVAVSPRIPGSVSTTLNSTVLGKSIPRMRPS